MRASADPVNSGPARSLPDTIVPEVGDRCGRPSAWTVLVPSFPTPSASASLADSARGSKTDQSVIRLNRPRSISFCIFDSLGDRPSRHTPLLDSVDLVIYASLVSAISLSS